MSNQNTEHKPNFITAPEVCNDCANGLHLFHIISELGDLSGHWAETEKYEGPLKRYIKIEGYAEDELWLEQLLKLKVLKE